jgi:hypothetical protein
MANVVSRWPSKEGGVPPTAKTNSPPERGCSVSAARLEPRKEIKARKIVRGIVRYPFLLSPLETLMNAPPFLIFWLFISVTRLLTDYSTA